MTTVGLYSYLASTVSTWTIVSIYCKILPFIDCFIIYLTSSITTYRGEVELWKEKKKQLCVTIYDIRNDVVKSNICLYCILYMPENNPHLYYHYGMPKFYLRGMHEHLKNHHSYNEKLSKNFKMAALTVKKI